MTFYNIMENAHKEWASIFCLPMFMLSGIFILRNKYVSSLITPSHISNTFFTQFRHGLTRQGQKTRTVKPRLRFGKVGLQTGLGLLASCQPHKQARAKGLQVLINATRRYFGGLPLVPERKDQSQNQLTGDM